MPLITAAVRRARTSFYGWRIVALMLGPRAGGTGTFILGSTLFVIPLEESMDLQRGTTSLLLALGVVISNITAPISGAIMDKHGPRRVLIISILVSAAGYILFSTATNVALLFIYMGLISLVIVNVSFNASTTFVNNWFERKKATALSVLQVGSGIGAVIIIPSLAFIIDEWGWRAAAWAAAAFLLATGLPAAIIARDTPEEMGLAPDGTAPRPASARPAALSGLNAREALRTRGFWMMVAAAAAFGGAQVGLGVHFVPIMVWKGMDEVEGALILMVMALASAPMVLFTGWLADRMNRLIVAAGIALVVLVGILLLNVGGPAWTTWAAVLLIAPNSGMYPLMWSSLGASFGRRAFSTIRGWVMALQTGGAIGMPILAGVLFDRSGSYSSVLWIILALWLVTAVLLMLTPQVTYRPGRSSAEARPANVPARDTPPG